MPAIWQSSRCDASNRVAPLLAQLAADNVLDEVVSQDEEFWNLDSAAFTYEDTLERSWQADIETVPTIA